MSYCLSISRRVNKRLEKLPVEVYDRVDGAILALADDERRVVEILNVAHRRDVYRQG